VPGRANQPQIGQTNADWNRARSAEHLPNWTIRVKSSGGTDGWEFRLWNPLSCYRLLMSTIFIDLSNCVRRCLPWHPSSVSVPFLTWPTFAFQSVLHQADWCLAGRLLNSPFSLTEVRVLYELAHRSRDRRPANYPKRGLDPGYLSRTLRSFEKQGLIRREASQAMHAEPAHLSQKEGRYLFR